MNKELIYNFVKMHLNEIKLCNCQFCKDMLDEYYKIIKDKGEIF